MIQTGNISLMNLMVQILIFSVLNFIPVGVMAETGQLPDKKRIASGKILYEQYCQSCHGVRGIGEPVAPIGIRNPAYFIAPALDGSQHAWHHTDEDLIKNILEGSPRTKRMAPWNKVLSENDARDLVDYMKSLWGPRELECQGPKHMQCM